MTPPDPRVRPRRDRVRVHGPDAASFLQGQLSQDVVALAVGERAWSLLLAPNGRTDAWLGVTRTADDTFELDVDAGFADDVVARLRRFLLRTKAEIEVAERAADVVDAVAERTRIEAGVPAMGAEITPDTIPAELGQWLVDASVSFTKGCYTGQELVARIDSRGGNVARHLRVLDLEGPPGGSPPEPGATIELDGRDVGTLTSVHGDATGIVALGFVHRSVEPPAEVTVAGQRASVRAAAEPG